MQETRTGGGAPFTETVHWIDGKAAGGISGEYADLHNPATGEVTGRVALADEHDVDRAVESAARAARAWGQTSLARRTAVLFAFRDLVSRRAPDLARVITAEHGKVLAD